MEERVLTNVYSKYFGQVVADLGVEAHSGGHRAQEITKGMENGSCQKLSIVFLDRHPLFLVKYVENIALE